MSRSSSESPIDSHDDEVPSGSAEEDELEELDGESSSEHSADETEPEIDYVIERVLEKLENSPPGTWPKTREELTEEIKLHHKFSFTYLPIEMVMLLVERNVIEKPKKNGNGRISWNVDFARKLSELDVTPAVWAIERIHTKLQPQFRHLSEIREKSTRKFILAVRKRAVEGSVEQITALKDFGAIFVPISRIDVEVDEALVLSVLEERELVTVDKKSEDRIVWHLEHLVETPSNASRWLQGFLYIFIAALLYSSFLPHVWKALIGNT